jgi:hypothetical protein
MRLLIVFLAACASGFAQANVSTACFSGSTTISSQGAYSASCLGPFSSASGEIDYLGFAEVEASASPYAGNPFFPSASASVSFTEDYVLTVTGGSGGGFVEAQLSAYAQYSDPYAEVSATASLGGCTAVPYYSFCREATPFVFNTPQILTLYVSLDASAGSGYNFGSNGDAGASWGQFEFFNAQMQPISVSYTFIDTEIPTPEASTLPVLTGIACAALIALKQRRRS